MDSNLVSAKHAIEAELSHARQGFAYYAARVEALESALHQLESVDGGAGESAAGPVANRRTKGQGKRAVKSGRQRGEGEDTRRSAANESSRKQNKKTEQRAKSRTAVESDESRALPRTGGDFWLDLVTEEPKSAVDISNAAIATLGIKPSQKTHIQKLKQRVSPALAGLLSAHKIKDTGSGRERRFFKAENQSVQAVRQHADTDYIATAETRH